MSSAERAAKIFRKLESGDFRILIAIELGMDKYEFVPVELIEKFSELPPAEVPYRIDRLHKMGLLMKWEGPYIGYVLNSIGYDCLALNVLVKSGSLDALGKPLGIGKESDVFDALSPQGERIAVKFHRLGRISFRQTRRMRGYIAKRERVPWVIQSRIAAEKEFQALKLVHPHGVAVPKPIAQNRHVIVMGLIEGAPLAAYMELPDPKAVLDEVVENVKKAYQKAGVIHADLSEYNILIKPDSHILIIDWPQFITKDHPNASALLRRDMKNVLSYFWRKFGIKRNVDEVLASIAG